MIQLTQGQLAKLLTSAAKIGAIEALTQAGVLKTYLKKADAFRMYGRANVERWIQEGLITPRKDGNHSASWRLDRKELEAVANASNRNTYLNIEERK